jgi:2-oxo-4-hydroxy-4-carboxy--5-ureidoimidazoline (OHCU) decarboxylase
MASMHTIQTIHMDSSLAIVLTTLFEHSPILISRLEPELATAFRNGLKISSYSELVELALTHIEAWDIESQTLFISGHPRIGESDKLSSLSAKEQGAQNINPTSPEVLGRLAHLNQCYETMYPGLRYITFVNGRSRAEILEEMENAMGLEHSLSPGSPVLGDLVAVDVTSEAWRSELTRAICDVGRIAQSRLKALGIVK